MIKIIFDKIEIYLSKIFCAVLNYNSKHIFILLGILTVLPLFFLSFFNNPASDDFDLSYESQVFPFWDLIEHRYFYWSGRYISNILFCFNPLVINNYFLFKIIPIAFILLFIYSLFFFISSLNLKISNTEKNSYVGLIFFLYLYQIPSVSEGFFWVTSLYVYLVSQIFILFFFSMFFQYLKRKKNIYFIFSCLFLFAAMGTNEITVVSILFILFITLLIDIHKNKIRNNALILIFILTFGFFIIEVIAPGNYARAGYINEKYQLTRSILKSFQLSISLIMKWIPIISLCCLFIFSNLLNLLKENINSKYIIHPLLSFFIFFTILYISNFICFYITGGLPAGRVLNLIYFFFIFGYIYFVINLLYFFSKKRKLEFVFNNELKICFVLIILLYAFSNNNITMAYHDLITGKAFKYNIEMKKRFELIINSNETEIKVTALTNLPLTIYSRDVMGLTTDKNNWKNLEIARYYRKKSITIKPIDTLITE